MVFLLRIPVPYVRVNNIYYQVINNGLIPLFIAIFADIWYTIHEWFCMTLCLQADRAHACALFFLLN